MGYFLPTSLPAPKGIQEDNYRKKKENNEDVSKMTHVSCF